MHKIVLRDDWPSSDAFGNETDEDIAGISTRFFADAIQCWASTNPQEICTVQNAAMAFNMPLEDIRHAVEFHPWMFLLGDGIEHDGE